VQDISQDRIRPLVNIIVCHELIGREREKEGEGEREREREREREGREGEGEGGRRIISPFVNIIALPHTGNGPHAYDTRAHTHTHAS